MPKRDWFQIITNIGVVAGLAFLVYELNQSRVHMDAQMVDASFQMSFQTNLAVMGENPASIIAKACSDLASLSEDERVALDAIHNSHYIALEHSRVMAMLGIFDEDWWKPATRSAYVYAYPGGVEWWRHTRPAAHPDLVEVIDKGIAQGQDYHLCLGYGNITNDHESG